MIRLMIASMRSRLVPIVLVIVALSASMALLLAVDRIQQATKNGFNQSLSGVDGSGREWGARADRGLDEAWEA